MTQVVLHIFNQLSGGNYLFLINTQSYERNSYFSEMSKLLLLLPLIIIIIIMVIKINPSQRSKATQ